MNTCPALRFLFTKLILTGPLIQTTSLHLWRREDSIRPVDARDMSPMSSCVIGLQPMRRLATKPEPPLSSFSSLFQSDNLYHTKTMSHMPVKFILLMSKDMHHEILPSFVYRSFRVFHISRLQTLSQSLRLLVAQTAFHRPRQSIQQLERCKHEPILSALQVPHT